MWSLSLLSSLRAVFWALVKLGLGGWEDLRTLLISALSSSASCWLSLVQAASMAVMYSKLGGCLGVTAKLGPLAKTDLWAGVKGLLERFMTHLGLGSSFEEPWGGLLGEWMCCLPGRWCWPPGKPELTYCWGVPIALPGNPSCVASLTCLGGPKGVRVRGVFALEGVIPSLVLGGRVDARGALASPGGRAVARDVLASLGGRAVAWDALASPGGRANAWTGRAEARGVLASLGGRANARGRVVLAWEGRAEAGEALASPGGSAVAWDALASPGGRANAWTGRAEARGEIASLGGRANAGGRVVLAWEGRAGARGVLASLEGRANAGGGVVLAWERTVPSLGGGVFTWEGGLAWEGVIPSLGGC